MKNLELLFVKNSNKSNKKLKFNSKEKAFIKSFDNKVITDKEIFDVIVFIEEIVEKYASQIVPIKIVLTNITFYDKLVYIVLECIFFYYNIVLKRNIGLEIFVKPTIWTEGVKYSPLLRIKNGYEIYQQKFLFDIYDCHYRKVVKYDKVNKQTNTLSIIMWELRQFLQIIKISDNNNSELTEVVIELVGNAIEHSKSDVLIDIDLTSSYEKEDMLITLNNKDEVKNVTFNGAKVDTNKILGAPFFNHKLRLKDFDNFMEMLLK